MSKHILTINHFSGEYNIPGLSQIAVQETVEGFIQRYEPIALREVFGATITGLLYGALNAVTPQLPLAPHWDMLINGGVYYRNGTPMQWPGIGSTDNLSFLAAYVFYWWSRNETSFTSGVGEVQPKSANATAVSPVMKQTRAWNLFVGLAKEARNMVAYGEDAARLPLFPEFGCQALPALRTINIFNL